MVRSDGGGGVEFFGRFASKFLLGVLVDLTPRGKSLINEIVDIALSATQIPLSIFTNLFHKRFQKHSMLESMLEILQQFYIQIETEPHDFLLFPGDSSLYTLRCMRCRKPVTLYGSIGETLLHAPTAMLYHWNIIQFPNKQNHRELMLMPLLFTSYEKYLQ